MVKSVIAAALTMLTAGAGPALAGAADCHEQLRGLAAQLNQKPGTKIALTAKYDEAQTLCNQHHERQAQDLTQQIQRELDGKPPETSGSSVAPFGGPAPQH